MEDICPPEVEAFIVDSEVDEATTMALLELDSALQTKVIKMGSLAGKANASELLMQRIQRIQGSQQVATEVEEGEPVELPEDLDMYIERNQLDDRAAEILRTCEPAIIAKCMEKGDVTEANNPSAALLGRLKQIRGKGDSKGKGKGKDKGKDKGKKAPKESWDSYVPPSNPDDPPTVLRLEIGAKQSPLMKMSPDAPAVIYQKGQSACSSSAYILGDLVGDIATQIHIDHDPEWQQYPEVAEAVKWACKEEHCVAVATCPSQGKWAVGLCSNWKGRESAAKLAMAIAITAGTNKIWKIGKDYPEFMEMCVFNGIVPPTGGMGGPTPKAMSMSKGKDPWGGKDAWGGGKGGGKGGGGGKDSWGASAPSGGIPNVHWCSLTEASEITDGGYPSECPAIVHSKEHNELFGSAGDMLYALVADQYEAVELKHDTEWDVFPEVGAALKAAGAEENCFCVASCPTVGKWGVGVGAGKKPRENSARLALAVAIAMEAPTPKSATMEALCDAANAAATGQPPAKRSRGW